MYHRINIYYLLKEAFIENTMLAVNYAQKNILITFFAYLGQMEISKLVCLFDLSNSNNQISFELFSLDIY